METDSGEYFGFNDEDIQTAPDIPTGFEFAPLQFDELELTKDQESLFATKKDIYELRSQLNVLITSVCVVKVAKQEQIVKAHAKNMVKVKDRVKELVSYVQLDQKDKYDTIKKKVED